jgi:CO/xanthine dehydrogenase Mo-binding subunit
MSLVGTNVTMVGGLAKVTGAINYAPDLVLPRMLYAKALRSPYPHAKLLRVDSIKAERYPGVVAVLTRDDLTGLNPYFGPVVDDQPVVASDRVRHVGEVVALVAGKTERLRKMP